MNDFIKQHFDKLLLTLIFGGVMGIVVHMIHHGVDTSSISWIENVVSQVLAALLTLMVGNRLAQRQNGGDTNGSPKTNGTATSAVATPVVGVSQASPTPGSNQPV